MSEPGEARSFWSEAWRRLKHDRIAMAGGVVVVLFFALAVFAPFIANDLPVYASFTNRHDYVRDFPGWKINHADLAADIATLQSGQGDAAKVRRRISQGLDRAATKLDQLAESLEGDGRAQAERLAAVYDQAAAAPDPATSAQQLQTVGAATLAALDPATVELSRQVRFPILRQLSWMDLWFALLFLSCSAAAIGLWRPVFRALARRVQDPLRLSAARALTIVAPALIGALTWAALVPPQSDQVPYREYAAQEGNSIVFTLIPYHPERGDSLPDQSPGTAPADEAPSHWLGTQEHGYDVLSGMVWGARISLSVGFVAVSIYVLIGIVLGALAGYFGGWTDHSISRVIEVVLCFPSLFLIITIMAYFPPSIFTVMVVIGLTGWPRIARLVRAEFLRLAGHDFVLAARALGMSPFRVIFRHILPNALAPVLVAAAFGVAGAILIESGLSYLGIGVPPGTPSWGTLLKSAQRSPQDYWWLTLFPGFAIFIAVTAYNLLAEGLRDATDPRLRT